MSNLAPATETFLEAIQKSLSKSVCPKASVQKRLFKTVFSKTAFPKQAFQNSLFKTVFLTSFFPYHFSHTIFPIPVSQKRLDERLV